LSSVYFFLFGAVGALSPYLSLYFHQMGLSGTQISLLMSVLPVLLFISQPLFGPLTDRSGHRGRMLAYLLLVVGATGLLVAAGRSFQTLLPLVMLWGFFGGPLTPIADSVALGEAARTGSSYPRLRLWGSIGFLLVTMALGRLYSVVDLRWAFVAYAVLNAAAFGFARRLPAEGVPGRQPVFREMGRVIRNPFLLGLLLCCGVVQMAAAAHSTFFTIHMAAIGGSSGTAGLAWALSAATEVPIFLLLGRVTVRTGPLPLLALSAAVYAVRWFLYSLVTVPAVLVWLQLLQAFSFAIFMPTAVVLVGELVPAELRSSGQSLLSLVNGGLATVLGTLAAGRLMDRMGTAGLYRVASYVALAGACGFFLLLAARRLQSRRGALSGTD
jgi:MFS transporter, PPP family, 3-phenylpropionic acid transporter